MLSVELFRQDVWQAVWSHAKTIVRPLFALSIIYTAILLGIFGLGFMNLLGPEFMDLLRSGSSYGMEDMETFQNEILAYLEGVDKTKLFLGFLIMYVLSFAVSALFFHIALAVSEQRILTNKTRIGEAIKRAFSVGTLRLLTILFILFLAYLGIVTLFGSISGSVGMAFLSLFIALVVCIRLSGALAASVHGSMSLAESLRFGWKYITWKRALFVMAVLIMSAIVVFLLMLLLQAIFGFMGAAGDFLNTVSLLIINAFLTALVTAMFSASFFRYAEFDVVMEGDSPENLQDSDIRD